MYCVNCMNCINNVSCSIFSKGIYFPEFCSQYTARKLSLLRDYIYYDDHYISSFSDLCDLGLSSIIKL